MLWHNSILIAICSLLLGCNTCEPAKSPTTHDVETFLDNCDQLQATDAFRQNIWVSFNGDSHGAIFMDLNHQLYLAVISKIPIRSQDCLSEQFKKLQVSITELSKQMDPDAFILNESTKDRIDGIYRIPTDTKESFVAELFNELMGLNLRTHDIRFQWD